MIIHLNYLNFRYGIIDCGGLLGIGMGCNFFIFFLPNFFFFVSHTKPSLVFLATENGSPQGKNRWIFEGETFFY